MGLAALAFAPGLALGSFLNVVAARVPLRRSLVSPGSACMDCGHEIAWYDNVPILSYARASRPLPRVRRAHSDPLPGRRARRRAALRRLLLEVRPHRHCRGRRVLLPDARRGLGDRSRAPDHPEPDRRARGPPRARREHALHPSPRCAIAAFAASGFLLAAALAYPAGMGMGDVKLAFLMGAALGTSVTVAMFLGMLAALVPGVVSPPPPRAGRPQDGRALRAVSRARLRCGAFLPGRGFCTRTGLSRSNASNGLIEALTRTHRARQRVVIPSGPLRLRRPAADNSFEGFVTSATFPTP